MIIRRTLTAWFPFLVVATIVCALIYVVAQQAVRQSADDPQIQFAEDVASALASGATPQQILAGLPHVNMATSLAPFIVMYDQQGNTLGTNAVVPGGSVPALPAGVFDHLRATEQQDRVTWQPDPALRFAAVIAPVQAAGQGSGFVLVARSLREIERRESQLTLLAAGGWAASLVGTFLACLLGTLLMGDADRRRRATAPASAVDTHPEAS